MIFASVGGSNIAEDTNACKQVKKELEESENKYQTLFESSPDAIVLLDENGFIDCNGTTLKTFGLSGKDELIGSHPFKLSPPNQPDGEDSLIAANKLMAEAFKKGYVEFEWVHRRIDGEDFPAEVWMTRLFLQDKQVLQGIIRDVTDCKQVEQMLEKERDIAQEYLDVVGVIIVAIDEDQKVTLINKKGCEILGYSEEEIIGKNWFDVFLPHRNRQEAKAVYQKLMSGVTKPAEYFENPILNRNGEEKLIAWHNSVLRDENGNITGTLSSGEDITQRRKVENDLRLSEQKYSTLVEKGNDGIIIVQDGLLKFVNSKYARMLGYTKEEVVGKPFFKDISEEYRELVIERYWKRLKKDMTIPRRYEVDFLSKDGRNIPVEINASYIEYEGRPADMVILRDITQRRQVEKELRTSEQKYSTLVEKGNDGIVIIQDYVLKFVNEKFAESVGYTRDEVIGRPLADFISAEHRNLVVGRYEQRIKDNHSIPRKYEVNFLSKDGKKVPIEVNASYIEYEGRPADMAIFRDISERKNAEAELKNYAQELKHSNELKDLFTDVLHHDLLNPAGVVNGFTEVLLEMEDDEAKIHLLKAIERNNKKLINMIETAATFAKLESVSQIDFVDMDIGSIFREVLENFKPQIEENRMIVEFLADGTYLSKVNPVLEEVFANFLSNAIKYSPKESRIIIDIVDSGEYWKVAVADFGEGVSDKDKPLIFERFKRVSKIGVKGTGLGLAIVKRIIDLHGGSVGVGDNPEGNGSVFWATVRKA